MLLANGAWDALAKLETALTKLARDESLRLVHYRTGLRENSSHLLPYLVEVVAADRAGHRGAASWSSSASTGSAWSS